MKLASVWTAIVQVFEVLTLSSTDGDGAAAPRLPFDFGGTQAGNDPGLHIPVTKDASGQFFHGNRPLAQEYSSGMLYYHPGDHDAAPLRTGGKELSFLVDGKYPVVGTPRSPQEGLGGGLNCHYPQMVGWESCYSSQNRSCWLMRSKGGEYKDVYTNYEDPDAVPVGTVRKVSRREQTHNPPGWLRLSRWERSFARGQPAYQTSVLGLAVLPRGFRGAHLSRWHDHGARQDLQPHVSRTMDRLVPRCYRECLCTRVSSFFFFFLFV